MRTDVVTTPLTRRQVLRRGAAALSVVAAPSVLAACGGSSAATSAAGGTKLTSKSVIYADYGGSTRAARVESFFVPFQQETGVQVISADADTSKLTVFAQSGRADWDNFDCDGWDVARFGSKGLLEKLPSSVKRADLVPPKYQDLATGGYSASVVIGHRTDAKIPRPESWADFFNLSKFPGKRALPNFAYFQIEAALLADGIPHNKIYPLDFDRGFSKLDTLRGNLLFWSTFGESQQFLAQGSAAMVLSTNSRMALLTTQGLPVGLVWNDAIQESWTAAAVPVGAPHSDAAFALASFMALPERQASFARTSLYGPTQSAALALLDPGTLANLPNSPDHQKIAFVVDQPALGMQEDEYNSRYTAWLAST